MFRLVLAAALAGLPAIPAAYAAGDFVNGSALSRACSGSGAVGLNSCDGYIAGVLDTVTGSTELKGKMCVPAGTKLSALREAVARYGQQHPDDSRGSGVALVYAMMKATYPCPAK